MYKGQIQVAVSDRVREIVKAKGPNQAQLTIRYPKGVDLKISSRNPHEVDLYRIVKGDNGKAKVSKDSLIGTFRQGDTNALWFTHQGGACRASFQKLFDETSAPTMMYAVYRALAVGGGGTDISDLDVSEIDG